MKRGRAASGLLIFISLAVASCGGQQFPTTQAAVPTTPTSARARLLAAVTRTTAAKTAKLAIGMTMSGLGPAGTITVTGSGVMDLAHQRMQMKIASTGPDAQSAEMRIIGATAYLNQGMGWTSQAVASTSATTPMPTNYLDELQGIAGTVRVEGTELLRDVHTTRYGATVDLDRAASRVGTSAQRAAIQQMVDQLHLPKIPVTVWIDDAGRLRKLHMVMDLGAVAAQFGAPAGIHPKIDMTLELYDFGVSVSVAVPAG